MSESSKRKRLPELSDDSDDEKQAEKKPNNVVILNLDDSDESPCHNSPEIDSIQARRTIWKNGVRNVEFLVKYAKKSHWHNSWISRDELSKKLSLELAWFESKYGENNDVNLMEEEWKTIDQILEQKKSQYYILWKGQPTSASTWETIADVKKRINESVLSKLVECFKARREYIALTSERLKKVRSAKFNANIKGLNPGLRSHQIEGVNWLREKWHKNTNCIIAGKYNT